MNIKTLILSIIFLFVLTTGCHGQSPATYRLALLINPNSPDRFPETVMKEVETLLANRFPVAFDVIELSAADMEVAKKRIDSIMTDPAISAIVGLSLGSSEALLRYGHYPKPVIAAAILDPGLQGLRITPENTSGIENFNFIQSPFNVENDLRTFNRLVDFDHLGILYRGEEEEMFHNIFSYLGKAVEAVSPAIQLSLVDIEGKTATEVLAELGPDIDAVYLALVATEHESGNQRGLIRLLNERKLPTFSLLGEQSVRDGALASIAPDINLKAVARRIAINLLNIAKGQNASKQKVGISSYTDNFVVNVGTMRAIDHYPDWQALEDARLINLTSEVEGRTLTLRQVILEALQNNLDLQIAQMDTRLQKEEIGIARSALLPQINLATSLTTIDHNRANGEPGNPAPNTWQATGSLSQTIFSDDLLANYEIQKLLLDSQRYTEQTRSLDTVVTAAEAYIRLLFARSNYLIINTNLSVTRKNLDIASNKAAIGATGASDVHRWESELASGQIELNDGHRDLQLAKINLNQVLDRPVNEPFNAEDIEPSSGIELMITDPDVFKYLKNFKMLSLFGDFLVAEADRNLPELHQIEMVIKSQERTVKNRKRALYLPDIRLTGQIDTIIDEYDTDFSTPSDLDHPWSLTAQASWPLFTGGSRGHDLETSRLEVRKSRLQSRDLRNQLHQQVRSNLETAAVSAREVELARTAEEAAAKNFEIIQAGYSEGRNSIADLIDAQNAKISSEQGLAIARYQFVLDFLTLERSAGRFHFLEEPAEKAAFLDRLESHMSTDATVH